MKRINYINDYLKEKFNERTLKIGIDAGFTCPNKDGTKGVGGCIYCSKLGSGDYAGKPNKTLTEQFFDVKNIIDKKWPNTRYIGYFQANTNTYAPVSILKEKYRELETKYAIMIINSEKRRSK